MTEAEWKTCIDPKPMLKSLHGKASPRKMRLAGTAFCRHVAHLLPADERCQLAMDVAESYADRRATRQELAAAHSGAKAAYMAANADAGDCRRSAALMAAAAVRWVSHPTKRCYPELAADEASSAAGWAALPPATHPLDMMVPANHNASRVVKASEMMSQSDLLRCIFGNPFRPSPPLPAAVLAWNDSTVRRLAEGIYEERAFHRLPILADALVDAGCEDEELIGHCRSEGLHVRGCWAIDLILGKS
jgi:hypothetical protein